MGCYAEKSAKRCGCLGSPSDRSCDDAFFIEGRGKIRCLRPHAVQFAQRTEIIVRPMESRRIIGAQIQITWI